ncbi:hypothetical protein NVP1244A_111 [Vibrio phage 1.244.A._10N.261.54.C3]|nr:hypothetical protein NVP1244A_111 [Vibrio phage 1.244.A._10N.261.54.C3]AUR98739.1 hypothetical protein NVP1255O_111 [Vibrio phage 1.255.O._10N.286.45.F1]
MNKTTTLGGILDQNRPSPFENLGELGAAVEEAFNRMVRIAKEDSTVLIMYADGDPSYKGLPYLSDGQFRNALIHKFAVFGVDMKVYKPCQYDGWTCSVVVYDILRAVARSEAEAPEPEPEPEYPDYINMMEKGSPSVSGPSTPTMPWWLAIAAALCVGYFVGNVS